MGVDETAWSVWAAVGHSVPSLTTILFGSFENRAAVQHRADVTSARLALPRCDVVCRLAYKLSNS